MEGWKNFYLQRMGVDGTGQKYPVCESVETWGVFCKDIPFRIVGDVKEPVKRTWPDEHGDDEFISSTGLLLEAYTIKVEFGCKLISASQSAIYGVAVDDVRKNVNKFIKYLRSSGMLKMYSSHTGIGRQNVRLKSVEDNAKWQNRDGEQWLIFNVVFKVNDPSTDMIYDSEEGDIVEEEEEEETSSSDSSDD